VIFLVRHQRFQSRLALVALASSLAGFAAVRRLPEAPLEYTIMWVTILGVLNWTVITGPLFDALLSWMTHRLDGRARINLRWATIALVAAVAAACTREVIALRAQDVRASPRIERLAGLARAKAALAATTTPLVVVPQSFWGVATGVVLQLRLAGL